TGHPREGVADLRGISPAYAGWTPPTHGLSPSFWLRPAGRRPRQKFTRPPSGSRLTTHKNPRCWTHLAKQQSCS
ncbi:hypothetical protein PT203_26610, partial [Klebsiella pneumoniae]